MKGKIEDMAAWFCCSWAAASGDGSVSYGGGGDDSEAGVGRDSGPGVGDNLVAGADTDGDRDTMGAACAEGFVKLC